MRLEQLKKAIGRTRVGDRYGTCFFVAERLLLTCAHNCMDPEGNLVDALQIRFSEWEGEQVREAKVIWRHPDGLDVALLEMEGEIPSDVQPCRLSWDVAVDDAFETWGYPMQTPSGQRCVGDIRDPSATMLLEGKLQPVLQLATPMAQDEVHGLSGAPLFVWGQVVGIISHQLKQYVPGDAERPIHPVFQTLYAVPITEAQEAPGIELLPANEFARRYDVLLCYAASEQEAGEEFHRELEGQGFSLWPSHRSRLLPHYRPRTIENMLQLSRAVVVCLGPSEGAVPWKKRAVRQVLQAYTKQDDSRLIPVLLPGASKPPATELPRFLRRPWLNFTEKRRAEVAESLLRQWLQDEGSWLRCQRNEFQGDEAEALYRPSFHGEPFHPFSPYTGENRYDFFGRSEFVEQLLKALQSHRHHVLMGASGCGKSSLLRAGLQPFLEDEGHRVIYIDCRHFRRELREQTSRLLPEGEAIDFSISSVWSRTLQQIQAPEGSSESGQGTEATDSSEIVILLDQFETLLLDVGVRGELLWLHEVFTQWAQGEWSYRLVLSLREDCTSSLYYPIHGEAEREGDAIVQLLKLSNTREQWHLLPLLTGVRAQRVVQKSLQDRNIQFDEEVLGNLIRDLCRSPIFERSGISPARRVSQQVYPPYLQMACQELHGLAQRKGKKVISLDEYRGAEELESLLGQHLRRVIEGRMEVVPGGSPSTVPRQEERGLPPEQQPIAWAVLRAIGSRGAQREPLEERIVLRRMKLRGNANDLVKSVLEQLHKQKLLALFPRERGGRYWNPSHDFLFGFLQSQMEQDPVEAEIEDARRLVDNVARPFVQKLEQPDQSPKYLGEANAKQVQPRLDEVLYRAEEELVAGLGWQEDEAYIAPENSPELQELQDENKKVRSLVEESLRYYKRLRWYAILGAGALALLLVVAIVLGLWARKQQKEAGREKQAAPEAIQRKEKMEKELQKSIQNLRYQEATTLAQVANAYAGSYYKPHRHETNLRQAISRYQQALKVLTKQKYPSKWATTLQNLGNAYQKLPRDREANLKKAVAAYQQALTVFTKQKYPSKWAGTLQNLGNAYSELPRDEETNLKKAIAAHKQALTVFTKQKYPSDWAMTLQNLGNAYQKLPRDKEVNLKKAIAAYQQALTVRTKQKYPSGWAMTLQNLGNAYQKLPRDKETNLKKAIAAYQQALTVRTKQKYPSDWAMTLQNLGIAYSELPRDKETNLKKAIAAYKQALTVRTKQKYPSDWAMTLQNLGNAYQKLPRDKETNLKKAIAAYKQALTVRTKQKYPSDWAMTLRNLGIAYSEFPRDKEVNLKKAIAAYQQALTVFTKQKYPSDWAGTLQNLGIAYSYRTQKREKHLLLALECYREAALVMPRMHPYHQKSLRLIGIDRRDLLKRYLRQKQWKRMLRYLRIEEEFFGRVGQKRIQLRSLELAAEFTADMMKNPQAAYPIFRKIAKLAPTEANLANLAEVAFHIRRYQEALRIAGPLSKKARSLSVRVVMTHLVWMVRLLQKSPKATAACSRLLHLYQKAKLREFGWNFNGTRAFLVKENTPEARKALRSLHLFAGPYSCERLRAQSQLCGVSLTPPMRASCPPTSRPHPNAPSSFPSRTPSSQPHRTRNP